METFKIGKFNYKSLKDEFEKLKPWITKFIINGKEFGGDFEAQNDIRINQFFQYFPNVQTILELGSLEGGHTFCLAKHPSVRKVIGIEGRQENLDKAKFVQKLLGFNNVYFMKSNLEIIDLRTFGRFDVVFCSGLLYHLPEPWKLIDQISKVSKNLFIWTHYAAEEDANIIITNGFKGIMYQEGGIDEPLSGLSPKSFWPTLNSLGDMLRSYGFKNIQYIENNPAHPNGPCITLSAKML